MREENFGVFLALALTDVFAIVKNIIAFNYRKNIERNKYIILNKQI